MLNGGFRITRLYFIPYTKKYIKFYNNIGDFLKRYVYYRADELIELG